MGCGKFLLGMAAGAAVGMIAYRCACTEKGKQWKEKMACKFRHAGDKAGNYFSEMKDKAVDTGVRVADKVAETAEEAKDKAHNFAREMKK